MLCAQGRSVRALSRRPDLAREALPTEVEWVRGDVTDRASIEAALSGCDVVYHAAGIFERWAPDVSVYDDVNADGSKHVFDAALKTGAERVIFVSTIDIFDAPPGATYDGSHVGEKATRSHCIASRQKAYRHAEAAMAAGHFKLQGLVAIIDRNGLCIDGHTEEIMGVEPIDDRFRSFGWDVQRIDGHDLDTIMNTLGALSGC